MSCKLNEAKCELPHIVISPIAREKPYVFKELSTGLLHCIDWRVVDDVWVW